MCCRIGLPRHLQLLEIEQQLRDEMKAKLSCFDHVDAMNIQSINRMELRQRVQPGLTLGAYPVPTARGLNLS
jgi:hypothetical protein